MGKKYLFENREQLIELLSLSIELVDKHFYRYCVYYDELITMAKKKIKEISLVEMVEIDEKNMVTEIYNKGSKKIIQVITKTIALIT